MDEDQKKLIFVVLISTAACILVGGLVWFLLFLGQFTSYKDSQYSFKLGYPKKWTKTEKFQGTAVSFVRPKQTALDVVLPNVNITVQEVPAHMATLTTFSDTITKQMTAVFDKNIKILEDKNITFARNSGHRLIFEAPNPNKLKFMVIWTIKGSFAYIFTFMADVNQYKELEPTIQRMVNSFEVK